MLVIIFIFEICVTMGGNTSAFQIFHCFLSLVGGEEKLQELSKKRNQRNARNSVKCN